MGFQLKTLVINVICYFQALLKLNPLIKRLKVLEFPFSFSSRHMEIRNIDDVFSKSVGPNKFSDGLFTCSHEKLISTKVYACSVF